MLAGIRTLERTYRIGFGLHTADDDAEARALDTIREMGDRQPVVEGPHVIRNAETQAEGVVLVRVVTMGRAVQRNELR